jgi:hypothetical protein
MTNIMKKNFNNNILFDFLQNTSQYNNEKNYYIFNNESYKKGQMNNYIENILLQLKDYYIKSKLIYLERTMNYKRFLTIIRQICKSQNICIEIKIRYIKSTYEIIYFIYNNVNEENVL